jgi:hypothetical protein
MRNHNETQGRADRNPWRRLPVSVRWFLVGAIVTGYLSSHATSELESVSSNSPSTQQSPAIESAVAVCHSATEDAVILDCNYRDGGWYQK